jgi:hypothetical protein
VARKHPLDEQAQAGQHHQEADVNAHEGQRAGDDRDDEAEEQREAEAPERVLRRLRDLGSQKRGDQDTPGVDAAREQLQLNQ